MVKLKLKTIIVAALSVFLFGASAYGQRTITGTVTDANNGESLIGVNILLVGTNVGTITDVDGTYELALSQGATQLQFSYTGYRTEIIEIGASNIIDVKMTAGAVLSEVVVIGYGTVKREDATGSVQTIGTKDFNRGVITAPQELLAGKIAGVQITTDPSPGGGAQIRIRGGSSLSASNDPLIVIDGIPLDNGGISGERNIFNFVNPNDIETFTVLKDASATAIYGSRASNGVILITTKKGRLGKKVTVEYNGNIGVSSALNQVEVLDAREYRTLIEERFPANHPARGLMGQENTNWQDQIYQSALATDHNLNFSGGIGPVPYRASVGYSNKDGILKTDNFQRWTGALNLSPGFMDNRLQINLNLKGMKTDNVFANRGAIGAAVFFDPTQPIFDEGNPYGGYFTWVDANGNPNGLAPANPLAQLNLRRDVSSVNRFVANTTFDYRLHFLPDLRANLNIGYDRSSGEGMIDVPAFASFAYRDGDGGEMTRYNQKKENSLLEFYLNYAKTLGEAKLDVMGGYSWQRFFFEDDFINSNLSGSNVVEGDNAGELYLLSLFGRVNLTLFDKLLATFTLRRDGTSRFSPDTRWGLFPAAALGYKLIDNKGMGTLSSMKLRLGWGVTGQQDVGGFYLYQGRYLSATEESLYRFGNEFIQTLTPLGYDANIKWEETVTYNAAVDYSLFEDRIYGSVEYYFRKTKDLINFIPVPAGTNLTNFITTNVGDLENKGVEFSINASAIKKKDFTWDVGFNVTANQNKITKLTARDDPSYKGVLVGGISGGVGNTIQIHSVGQPANSFYVFEQVYDQNGVPIEGLYVDRNGDGRIDDDDRYWLENPVPTAYFGMTSNMTYGNFDFSFGARANVGNHVYNNVQSNGGSFVNLYHPTNYLGNVNQVSSYLNFQNPQYISDYFIQNASFLRFDHITLGYNFGDMVPKISFLKVFATVQNPILITKYVGIDPEIAGGIDNNIYPRARTFLMGVNARF